MFPRTSGQAFILRSIDYSEAEKWADENNYVLEIIYHSHIDSDSYFSEEDKRFALNGDELVFPEVKHLVVSVFQGKAKNYSLFSWDENKKSFLRDAIEF